MHEHCLTYEAACEVDIHDKIIYVRKYFARKQYVHLRTKTVLHMHTCLFDICRSFYHPQRFPCIICPRLRICIFSGASLFDLRRVALSQLLTPCNFEYIIINLCTRRVDLIYYRIEFHCTGLRCIYKTLRTCSDMGESMLQRFLTLTFCYVESVQQPR